MAQQKGTVRKIVVDKEKFTQINVMQRSAGEMGKFDNASATSVPMAKAACLGSHWALHSIFSFWCSIYPRAQTRFIFISMTGGGFLSSSLT